MCTSTLKTIASIGLSLATFSQAQVNLSPIDTATCAGQGSTGTATFSSDMTIATGSQRIPAGKFWTQEGAIWVFDTNTPGIQLSDLAIPGGGPSDDVPAIDTSALKLDDSKTKWTLAAPTVSSASKSSSPISSLMPSVCVFELP